MDFAQPIEHSHALSGVTRRHALASTVALAWSPLASMAADRRLDLSGMVWQPSAKTMRPHGDWQQLGIQRLLIQWTAVDNASFLPDAALPPIAANLPDWGRIASEPWAQEVIVGLAGMHSEGRARTALPVLAAQSHALWLAAAPWPLRVSGWYFPVEVDPTWAPPPELTAVLAKLPKPLWISAYDSANLGPQALADWIQRWVPADVGVLFQDGVGVHARTPAVARQYLQQLSTQLGAPRVQAIAEAFRPQAGGGFRSATADEFLPQIESYQDWPIFAFDGPHYLGPDLVHALRQRGVGPR